MTLRELNEEEEKEPVSEEEAKRRIRQLAWGQPDFNFSILEALMDHLGIPEEQQREIIMEGVKKWRV